LKRSVDQQPQPNGKTATRRSQAILWCNMAQGAENFAQHFSFPEMALLADLPRVRPTLFGMSVKVSQML